MAAKIYLFTCLTILIFLEFIDRSDQEMFTAVVDLERLLSTEKEIVRSLDKYIELEEERLQKLRHIREYYDHLQVIASQDVKKYVQNPINAYILVKRMTTDWKNVEYLMESGGANIAKQLLRNLTEPPNNDNFPSSEDLSGAVDALLRLQKTYNLDASTIASGKIEVITKNGNQNGPIFSNDFELSAGDCFELGRHSYTSGNYYITLLWMQEALDRYENEKIKSADKADILEYLAFSTFQQGNIRRALFLTNQLLELQPNHPRATGNKIYYESMLKDASSVKKRGDDGDVPFDEQISESEIEKKSMNEPKEETEREIYESLCRGENRLSPATLKELKCYHLDTRDKPYLRLMKIKVETAFKKPNLLIYYDILSDSEIEVIKELATPRLRRATVQNSVTGNLEVAAYRISKSAWLKAEENPVIDHVNKRIGAITGLDINTAEELQVVNYGLGGHYESHYDFARREEKNAFKNLNTGNRIATWLNYMSDVEAGGATVFPHLGAAIWPKKGSAAFWFNLFKSGEGDLLTRHAACPVLVGSKWVSNKWFHERGQEFRRPCGLKINE